MDEKTIVSIITEKLETASREQLELILIIIEGYLRKSTHT